MREIVIVVVLRGKNRVMEKKSVNEGSRGGFLKNKVLELQRQVMKASEQEQAKFIYLLTLAT